jgi:hypothetical protein
MTFDLPLNQKRMAAGYGQRRMNLGRNFLLLVAPRREAFSIDLLAVTLT